MCTGGVTLRHGGVHVRTGGVTLRHGGVHVCTEGATPRSPGECRRHSRTQRITTERRSLRRLAGRLIFASPAMLFLPANDASTRDVEKIAHTYLEHAVEVTGR